MTAMHLDTRHLLSAAAFLACGATATAQSILFAAEDMIDSTLSRAVAACSGDLDGDGDPDLVYSDSDTDRIFWKENDGSPFFLKLTIDSTFDGAGDVHCADLDGDGDVDVLAAAASGDLVAWYENPGGGLPPLPPRQVLTTTADAPNTVLAADLDGDGDLDVLLSASFGGTVSWIENTGSGTFGPRQTITNSVLTASCVAAADLDGDGDLDVISTSKGDEKIAWYENLGGGAFGSQQVISTAINDPESVDAADLDGDGDADLIVGYYPSSFLRWFENLGGGLFGPAQLVEASFSSGGENVSAVDLDGDGDSDILVAGVQTLGWYPNLGGGTFAAFRELPHGLTYAKDVHAVDVNGDGTLDVVAVTTDLAGSSAVSWYEGLPDCNENGIEDAADISSGTSLDLDGNGVPDECDCPAPVQYCPPPANSTGGLAVIRVLGEASLSTNQFGLRVTGMPANKPGILFYGQGSNNIPLGDGTLCVSGGINRISPASSSNANGVLTRQVDLGLHGLSVLAPGDKRNFQLWFRDPQGGPVGFTFSSAVEVQFCP